MTKSNKGWLCSCNFIVGGSHSSCYTKPFFGIFLFDTQCHWADYRVMRQEWLLLAVLRMVVKHCGVLWGDKTKWWSLVFLLRPCFMTKLSSVILIHDHIGFSVSYRPSSRLNNVSGEGIGLDGLVGRIVWLLCNHETHVVDLISKLGVNTVEWVKGIS